MGGAGGGTRERESERERGCFRGSCVWVISFWFSNSSLEQVAGSPVYIKRRVRVDDAPHWT